MSYSDQFVSQYGGGAAAADDDPFYAEWRYYQSQIGRGNVSGGVLEEPNDIFLDDPTPTTTNADGSVTPVGASGPAADQSALLNPGFMANVQALTQRKPGGLDQTKTIRWLLLALVAWLVWRAVK